MGYGISARRRTWRLLLGLAAVCVFGWVCTGPSWAASPRDWPQYQYSRADAHTSDDVSETVRALQYLLCARGYTVVTDGILGKSTDAALRRFQRTHHLIVDGCTKASTWEALVLRVVPGSKGQAVSAAQVMLRAAGYDVKVDGHFDPRMAAAIRKFQSQTSHTADGIIGLNTWSSLIMADNEGD